MDSLFPLSLAAGCSKLAAGKEELRDSEIVACRHLRYLRGDKGYLFKSVEAKSLGEPKASGALTTKHKKCFMNVACLFFCNLVFGFYFQMLNCSFLFVGKLVWQSVMSQRIRVCFDFKDNQQHLFLIVLPFLYFWLATLPLFDFDSDVMNINFFLRN